jgi:hypothetical protein
LETVLGVSVRLTTGGAPWAKTRPSPTWTFEAGAATARERREYRETMLVVAFILSDCDWELVVRGDDLVW